MDTTKTSVESRATLSGQKLNYMTPAGLIEVTFLEAVQTSWEKK